MNEIELKKLYEKISIKFNIGTFDEFKSKMQTVEQRKSFYDVISKKFNIGEYNDYVTRLGVTSQTTDDTQTPPPTGDTQTPPPTTDWYSPIFNWTKGRPGKHKLSPSGDYFWYYLGNGIIFNFNKNGFFSYQLKDGTSDPGKWISTGDNSFKITCDNGDVFDSTTSKWIKSEKQSTLNVNYTGEDVANGKLVKIGMKGNIVGEIQNLLISKGFKEVSKTGKSDNVFGPLTEKMVKEFQTKNGLKKVDGIVGPNTWSKLKESTTQDTSGMGDDSPEFLQAQQDNQEPKDAYNPDSAKGELEYNMDNQDLKENLIKKIVSKNLKSLIK